MKEKVVEKVDKVQDVKPAKQAEPEKEPAILSRVLRTRSPVKMPEPETKSPIKKSSPVK